MRSFVHALKGLGTFVATQRNARIHCVAAILAVAAGVHFGLTATEWCTVILAIGMVLCAEALNTGLEFVCDAVHPESHPLIGKAKDVAAAGVLIAAVAAAAAGAVVFVPYLSR